MATISVNSKKRVNKHDFRGNTDRDEVQVSLDKFLQLLEERETLRDTVRDLQLSEGNNPFSKWSYLALTVNEWRVFPRLFFAAYIILFMVTAFWFMGLDAPSAEQAAFLSVIMGMGAAWFNSYTKTGPTTIKDGQTTKSTD